VGDSASGRHCRASIAIIIAGDRKRNVHVLAHEISSEKHACLIQTKVPCVFFLLTAVQRRLQRPSDALQLKAGGGATSPTVRCSSRAAGRDDGLLAAIGRLTEVARSRLSRNAATGRTVGALTGMQQLERLNLYANAGDHRHVDVLAVFPLQRFGVCKPDLRGRNRAPSGELRPDLDCKTDMTGAITGVELANPSAVR
jgi:hypothetical protein